MGMFDHVYCEFPLPDGFDPKKVDREYDGVFQTKSFDCLMDSFKITSDGKFKQLSYELIDTGKKRRLGPPDPHGEEIEWPVYERINEEWNEYYRDGRPFHGEFNFYTSVSGGGWHEYIAVYSHGQLEEIICDEQANKFFRERQNERKRKERQAKSKE